MKVPARSQAGRINRFLPQSLLFVVNLLLLSPATVTGQVKNITVTGVVIDSVERVPVPYANVFIANTTKGTMTDENGFFTLPGVPASGAEVVFQSIGYQTGRIYVTGKDGGNVNLRAVMSPYAIPIDEVVIKGRPDPNRNYFIRIFREFFLGDPYEDVCRLKNPEDVDLKRVGNMIIGTARKPLIIENYHLGYSLSYNLEYFAFQSAPWLNLKKVKVPSYYTFQGTALYRELEATVNGQQKKWESNRKRLYEGSFTDFLARLYQNQLVENRYRVTPALLPPIPDVGKAPLDSILWYDPEESEVKYLKWRRSGTLDLYGFTHTGPNDSTRILSYPGKLVIIKDFSGTSYTGDDEVSLLSIGKAELVFNRRGEYQVYNGDLNWGILNTGQKVINLLPLDYRPEKE
jgi:hypothetical protein